MVQNQYTRILLQSYVTSILTFERLSDVPDFEVVFLVVAAEAENEGKVGAAGQRRDQTQLGRLGIGIMARIFYN